jgi:Flp pilus assembly pilin Flp
MVNLTAARTFVTDEDGASLVEYSLLVALIAAASIAVLYNLGQEVVYIFGASNNSVSTVSNAITSATGN